MMNEPHALALSSFDERQWAPRLLLYQAVAGPLREGAAAEPGAATKRVHESGEERGKVLKKTLSRCLSAIPEKRVVVSKQGGTFLCRPDQITLFRPSG